MTSPLGDLTYSSDDIDCSGDDDKELEWGCDWVLGEGIELGRGFWLGLGKGLGLTY